MSNPRTLISSLNLSHGSMVYLFYEGEQTVPGRPAMFAPAGSFDRKMTMDDLIVKQMKVTRQENPHCELVSFDRDAANVFQQYMNESLAFGVKRGGFMYGVVTKEEKVTMATFLPIRPTSILSPFQDRTRLPIPTHPLLHRTQYNSGYGGVHRKQFHRCEVGVVRFGFRPPPFLMDSDGATEGVIKELFGRAESVLYTIVDAAVSFSDTVSTTKVSNDWLSGITYYMESVLKVESAMAMQSLQPQIKAIQEWYAGNQERIQLETAQLYKLAGINPLAGGYGHWD